MLPRSLRYAAGIITALAVISLSTSAAVKAASPIAKKRVDTLQPTQSNIAYGPSTSNVLDFWQAESSEPTPVLIFFHGGGFVGGDKAAVKPDLRLACLENGISVVSANYLRFKAAEWHINPAKIALAGGSAGANISLWLGLHDDLADPNATDPIARLSTRVSAVLSFNGQTSNDPEFILHNIGGGMQVHPSLYGLYEVGSLAEMARQQKKEMAFNAFAINFATSDDPPVYLRYDDKLLPVPHEPGTPEGIVIHSPRFGAFLKERLDALGVECIFHHPDNPDDIGDQIAFLLRHLKS